MNEHHKVIDKFIKANNHFKKHSTSATCIILLIFGFLFAIDSCITPNLVSVKQEDGKIDTKLNSTYHSYNNVASSSRYFSSVLHVQNYSLLLTDLNEKGLVKDMLENGTLDLNVTPIFGQVKSYFGAGNKEIWSKNFVYSWWCYGAALLFILLQLIIKEKAKVFEYLFAYIAIFMMLYILFYI